MFSLAAKTTILALLHQIQSQDSHLSSIDTSYLSNNDINNNNNQNSKGFIELDPQNSESDNDQIDSHILNDFSNFPHIDDEDDTQKVIDPLNPVDEDLDLSLTQLESLSDMAENNQNIKNNGIGIGIEPINYGKLSQNFDDNSHNFSPETAVLSDERDNDLSSPDHVFEQNGINLDEKGDQLSPINDLGLENLVAINNNNELSSPESIAENLEKQREQQIETRIEELADLNANQQAKIAEETERLMADVQSPNSISIENGEQSQILPDLDRFENKAAEEVVTEPNFTTTLPNDDDNDDNNEDSEEAEPIQALEVGQDAAIAEQKSSNKIFFILSILGLSIMVIHALIKFHLHYFPESLIVMMLGMLIGAMLNNTRDDDWLEAEFLHPSTFFLVLLPPIILDAGYNLNKVTFFENIGTIMVYAVFGTIISTVVVGVGIYLISLGASNYELTTMEAAAYGSLISAVDPVATIAIFSAMNVDPTLNMLVFGESILNDAVSIVLTNMFQSAASWDKNNGSIVWHCVVEFIRMFIGSAALGIFAAIVTALILKHLDLRRTPSLELGMMLVFSYIPYGLAEASGLSGIMSLLFSGIVMSHYAHHNLSLVSQINLQHTLRTLAFLAETSVFAYIGLAMWSFEHDFQPSFCIGSILLILIARACNIYPLSFIVNKFRESSSKINSRMQFVMWFSGLRGAIAYVLSLHLDVGDVQIRRIVITGTLGVVIFTIVVLGGSTYPLIKFLKITGPEQQNRSAYKNKKKKKKQEHVTLSKTEVLATAIESDGFLSGVGSNNSHDGSDHKDSEDSDCDDMKRLLKNTQRSESGFHNPVHAQLARVQSESKKEYQVELSMDSMTDGETTSRERQFNNETSVMSGYTSGNQSSTPLNADHNQNTKKKRTRSHRRSRTPYKDQDISTFRGAFSRLDSRILIPLLCRRVTREELIENRTQMRQFASKWYDEVRNEKGQMWGEKPENFRSGSVTQTLADLYYGDDGDPNLIDIQNKYF